MSLLKVPFVPDLCVTTATRAHRFGLEIDVDDDNVRTSQKTVAMNGLESRIQVIKTDAAGELIPLNTKIEIEVYVPRHSQIPYLRLNNRLSKEK